MTQEPTSASLAVVSPVAFGAEFDQNFRLTPAPRTSGTPTGEFKIITADGSTTLCDDQLHSNGVGQCSMQGDQLPPGTYQFFGEYEGDSTFSRSVSDLQTVTITPGVAPTDLALSQPTIGFGQQQNEQMTVHVDPEHLGTPTGPVNVMIGGTTLCSAELPASGVVTCNLGIGELPIGSYEVVAAYDGDSNFAGSTSTDQLLTITGKSTARPSLTLSKSTVTFGQEQAAKFTANVTGQVSGITPSGTVTIDAGSVALCSFTLKAGQGSCKTAAAKLSPGTYHLTASYGGDVTYGTATSASQSFTVAAAPTTTSLTLSKAKVKAGQEQKETLSVAVQPKVKSSLPPGGKVTVKAGSTTICVITLTKAKGSCTLTAKQLRPGTYQLTAVYAGGSPFARSVSAKKTLTVTK